MTRPAVLVQANNALIQADSLRMEMDSRIKSMLGIVQAASSKLNPRITQLLRATAIGRNLAIYYSSLSSSLQMLKYYSPATWENDRAAIKGLYDQLDTGTKIEDGIGALVPDYLRMTLDKARLMRVLAPGEPPVYDQLKQQYTGLLREKMICTFLLEYGRALKNLKELLDDATTYVKTASCLSLLNDTIRTSTPGMPAFAFSLPDINGNTVKLEDLKGKIVFIDFWYTGCGACSKFYTSALHEVEKKFLNNPDVVFVTISIDIKKEQWLQSVASGRYTTPHAANVVNLYTEGKGGNHDIINWYKIRGYPQQILIGKDGKIIRATDLQLPAEQLITVLTAALGATGT